MLISHRYKFIFLKSKKTASTSTEAYLERYCVSPDEEEIHQGLHTSNERVSNYGIIGSRMNGLKGTGIWFNHKTPLEIKRDIGEEMWDSYVKICNIRNPYDLAVSLYHDSGNIDVNSNTFHKFLSSDIIKNVLLSNKKIWSINGEYSFDFYLRHERLTNDINKMMSKLNLKKYNYPMPRYKESNREHYSKYYTNASKKIIEEIYSEELNKFNYNFYKDNYIFSNVFKTIKKII